jgi:hypothetical protein
MSSLLEVEEAVRPEALELPLSAPLLLDQPGENEKSGKAAEPPLKRPAIVSDDDDMTPVKADRFGEWRAGQCEGVGLTRARKYVCRVSRAAAAGPRERLCGGAVERLVAGGAAAAARAGLVAADCGEFRCRLFLFVVQCAWVVFACVLLVCCRMRPCLM